MHKKTKYVLIADDDAQFVEAMSQRFRKLGLEVVPAYNGIEAIRATLETKIDLICIDINMPAADGLTVCEALSQDDEFSSIPLIVLTGCADPATAKRCSELCAYYLRKSTDLWSRLLPVIEELIDLSTVCSAL